MSNDGNFSAKSRQIGNWVLLTGGVLAMLLGLLLTGGFLGSNRPAGLEMGDIFLALATLIFLYFLPSLVIARALKGLRSYYQLGTGGIFGILFFGLSVFTAGTLLKTYNQFVQADENINQAFTNVDIAYQKRFNLIRNLATAAERYTAHERGVVKDIVEARKSALAATTSVDKISKFSQFDMVTRALVLNIENYPNLKADQIVQTLMKEITSTENDLLEMKTAYNARVTDYNKSVRLMPFGLLARVCGFQPKQVINNETGGAEIYDAQKLLEPR